jgi:hypothetical protein
MEVLPHVRLPVRRHPDAVKERCRSWGSTHGFLQYILEVVVEALEHFVLLPMSACFLQPLSGRKPENDVAELLVGQDCIWVDGLRGVTIVVIILIASWLTADELCSHCFSWKGLNLWVAVLLTGCGGILTSGTRLWNLMASLCVAVHMANKLLEPVCTELWQGELIWVVTCSDAKVPRNCGLRVGLWSAERIGIARSTGPMSTPSVLLQKEAAKD